MIWMRELSAYSANFTNNTKLGGAVDTLEANARIQNGLEKWSTVNQLKFNRDNSNILHLGQNNCMPKSRLGNDFYDFTSQLP